MTYPRLVLTTWLLALLLTLLLAYDLAHAGEVSLEVGGGVTHFTCTICNSGDGTWVQTGLPHSMTMNSLAWKTGLAYRVTEQISLHTAYVNLGTAKIRQDYTVSDAQYDPHTHSCLAPCTNLNQFNTHDLMEGVELAVSYHWRYWLIQPYAKVGAAGLYHRLTAQNRGTTTTMHGWVPSTVLGGGADYGWFFLDASYYRGLGGVTDWSAGLPISKEQIVTILGIHIPLGG